MKRIFQMVSTTALVIGAGLFSQPQLMAQDNGSVVIELMKRVGAIEEENRELRGQLETSQHELSQLKQKMETLSADVDYRLNNPDSGSTVGPAPNALSETSPHEGGDNALSFNSSEEYERARSLLEQGEYEAAEKAFAAFVSHHPKDDQAGAAQYWLGVTFFVRGQYEKAAAGFAKGYKNYSKSPKAADMLLKLSKSLAALDQKANACATHEELSSKYPKAHVKEVESDRKKWGCK
jgi:tol-pal system protein YbgF